MGESEDHGKMKCNGTENECMYDNPEGKCNGCPQLKRMEEDDENQEIDKSNAKDKEVL